MTKSKSLNKKSSVKGTVSNSKKKASKTVNKKINDINTTNSVGIRKALITLFVVALIFGSFYLLTLFITGSSDKKEEIETSIQYDEILAGSSFNMKNDEYLVVYYDFSNTELANLTSQISSYSYTGDYRLYTVDMSNAFNKAYVGENASNTSPESAEDLLIKEPTLIRFKEGKVSEYIEGIDAVINYLK